MIRSSFLQSRGIRMTRPDYNRMYEVMKRTLAPFLGTLTFSVMISEIIPFVFASVFSAVSIGVTNYAASYVLLCVSIVLIMFVSVSLVVCTINQASKITLGKGSRISSFFEPFFIKRKNLFSASAILTLMQVVSFFIVFFIIMFNRDFFAPALKIFEKEIVSVEALQNDLATIMPYYFFAIALFSVIGCALSIPFLFVWNVMETEKNISFSGALKKSASILVLNYFHYVGFNFYVVIKNLMVIAVLAGINLFVSRVSFLAFFSLVTGFLILLQQYTVISKIIDCVPVYYYSYMSVNGLLNSSKKV